MISIYIRALLLHYWKQGFSAEKAAKAICDVEGDDAVTKSTAHNWFEKFNDGDTSLEAHAIPGRPLTINKEAILIAAKQNPTLSAGQLAELLGTSKATVLRCLKTQRTQAENGQKLI
ncbi:unnamed protein product [Bursaphelenchus okinawaensis]|uniref:Mos1 transposase HTH domain-containing protein n=1 Tax=Bursaphelenchus okinawaensis TaxID=465554 RepID=A0A811KTS9_9BILA|nr:unnamed protein product [Bursaphelenchus okinawaensis]CAG9111484.1 unnamed protein product [Bursaphelenchus okinawaensis]